MTRLWEGDMAARGLRCDGCGRMERGEGVNPAAEMLAGEGWAEVVSVYRSGEEHYCPTCWALAESVLPRAA